MDDVDDGAEDSDDNEAVVVAALDDDDYYMSYSSMDCSPMVLLPLLDGNDDVYWM